MGAQSVPGRLGKLRGVPVSQKVIDGGYEKVV